MTMKTRSKSKKEQQLQLQQEQEQQDDTMNEDNQLTTTVVEEDKEDEKLKKKRKVNTTTTTTTTSTSTKITKYDQLSIGLQSEIKEAFDLFKSDNGKIDTNQIKYAFRALGVEPDSSINSMTKDTTSMTFGTFKEMTTKLLPKRESQSTLEQAFKLFDKDDNGKISFEDLKLVAVNLGEECSDDDLREMIEFADLDGDGEINKSEFITVLTSKKII
ncbi:centrin [Cavenderia fasciculata]|uniref:Centrin n=1 Tax=Cavenderia fasciculata TaxID=261658 RepID=F4Q1E6_CACFS|nr:centrin [Cavenderia fasciculata]EGG18647.1 centrin [Cavenderia fasciculata]|eukprot:XP_004366551.1 centrin [Cavenderia fasciculata]